MADGFLSTNELAERWNLRYGILARWRQHGTGPAFLKFGKVIRYRLEDIIEYEQRTMHRLPDANNATPDANNSLTEAAEDLPRLTIQDVVAALRFNAC